MDITFSFRQQNIIKANFFPQIWVKNQWKDKHIPEQVLILATLTIVLDIVESICLSDLHQTYRVYKGEMSMLQSWCIDTDGFQPSTGLSPDKPTVKNAFKTPNLPNMGAWQNRALKSLGCFILCSYVWLGAGLTATA
jgi:hypothetical protein